MEMPRIIFDESRRHIMRVTMDPSDALLNLLHYHKLIDDSLHRELKTKDKKDDRIVLLLNELEQYDDKKMIIFFEDLVAVGQRYEVNLILGRQTKDNEFAHPSTVVCYHYTKYPHLMSSLPMVPKFVRGVTLCDNKLFGVCHATNTISVFDWETRSGFIIGNIEPTDYIKLNDLEYPTDIVSCTETKQLYVAGTSNYYGRPVCVWRVSLDGGEVVMLLPNQTTTPDFSPWTLSVTSRRLLVTSLSSELLLYGADGVELKRFSLPEMKDLQHAVETSRGTFIVCHHEPEPRVCEVNVDGLVIRVYQEQLCRPDYLSLDSDGRVFVGNHNEKHPVLLLNSRLEPERVLINNGLLSIGNLCSMRLCYVEQSGKLAVSASHGCHDSIELFQMC